LHRNKSNFNRVQKRREVIIIRKHSYERNPPEEGRRVMRKSNRQRGIENTVQSKTTRQKDNFGRVNAYSWDVYRKNQRQMAEKIN
jgi:hypothetical protein